MTQDTKYISRMNDFGGSFERQHSSHYGAPFVKEMIERGGIYASPRTGITYRIPTHFGFCYGVEKSIDMAFETTRRFPDRRVFLTHDVIHNPRVNQDLLDRGVCVLARDVSGRLLLDDLRKEDIVVIAAFGSRFADVEAIRAKECLIIDTTCGAIVMVWKRVEKYAKNGCTAVIHGIFDHEETQATASQAVKFGGNFIIVRNLEEARLIGERLDGAIFTQAFMAHFKNRVSPGFDPARDLDCIGIASQTTMLENETREIQEYLRARYRARFGDGDLARHFMLYDTICSATQERQDALVGLLETRPDLVLIVGGFNSSNTTHLAEITLQRAPTYHIRGAEDLLSKEEIHHLDSRSLKEKKSSDWLPRPLSRVAISSGASTPDILIEKVISRVEEFVS